MVLRIPTTSRRRFSWPRIEQSDNGISVPICGTASLISSAPTSSFAFRRQGKRTRLAPRPLCPPPTALHPRLSRLHLQLVFHAEDARNLIRSQASDVPIHAAINRAVKRNVAVHHDNANRPRRIHRVLAQHRVAINSSGRAQAHPLVKRRNWFDRDVRDHVLYPLHRIDVRESFVPAQAR